MSSLRKRPKSDYWVCCYTLPDGSRTQRSTGCKDKGEAWAMCQAWEAEAKTERDAQPFLTKKRKRMLAVAAVFLFLLGIGLWLQIQPKGNPELFVDLDSKNAPDSFREIDVAARFRWVTLDEQALKEISRPGAEIDLNFFPDEKHTVWIVGNQAHDKDFDTSTGLIDRDLETMVILAKNGGFLRGFVATKDAKQLAINYGGPTKDGRKLAFAVMEVDQSKLKACGVVHDSSVPDAKEVQNKKSQAGESVAGATGGSGDQKAFERLLLNGGISATNGACLGCVGEIGRPPRFSLRAAPKSGSQLREAPLMTAAVGRSLLGRGGAGMGRSAHPAAAVNVLYPRPAAGPHRSDYIDVYFLLAGGGPDPLSINTILQMNILVTQQNAIFARSQIPMELRMVGLDRAKARAWSNIRNVPPDYTLTAVNHTQGDNYRYNGIIGTADQGGPVASSGSPYYGGWKPSWIETAAPTRPMNMPGSTNSIAGVMGHYSPYIMDYNATDTLARPGVHDMDDSLDWLVDAAGREWGPRTSEGNGYKGNSQIYGDQYWGLNTPFANHHPLFDWGLEPNFGDGGYGPFITFFGTTNGTTNYHAPQSIYAANPYGPIHTNNVSSSGWHGLWLTGPGTAGGTEGPIFGARRQVGTFWGMNDNGLGGGPPNYIWRSQMVNVDIFTGPTFDPTPYRSLFRLEGAGRGTSSFQPANIGRPAHGRSDVLRLTNEVTSPYGAMLPYAMDYNAIGGTPPGIAGIDGNATWFTERTKMTGANPALIFNPGNNRIDVNKSITGVGWMGPYVIPGLTKVAFTGARNATHEVALPVPLRMNQDYWYGNESAGAQIEQLVITGGGPTDQFRLWVSPAPPHKIPGIPYTVWPTVEGSHASGSGANTGQENIDRFTVETEYADGTGGGTAANNPQHHDRRSNAGKVGYWEHTYQVLGDMNTFANPTDGYYYGRDERDRYSLTINGMPVGVHERNFKIIGDGGRLTGPIADRYIIDINGTVIGEERDQFTIIGDATPDSDITTNDNDKYEVKINGHYIGYQRQKYNIAQSQYGRGDQFVIGFLGHTMRGSRGNATGFGEANWMGPGAANGTGAIGWFPNPLGTNGKIGPLGVQNTRIMPPQPSYRWNTGALTHDTNASAAWAIKMAVDMNQTVNEWPNGGGPFVRTEVSHNSTYKFTIEGDVLDTFVIDLNVTAPPEIGTSAAHATQANPANYFQTASGSLQWIGSNATTAAAFKTFIEDPANNMSQYVDVNVTATGQSYDFTIIGDTNGTANGWSGAGPPDTPVLRGTDYYIVKINGIESYVPYAFGADGAGNALTGGNINNTPLNGSSRGSNATAAANIKTFLDNNSTLNPGVVNVGVAGNVLTITSATGSAIDANITAVDFNDFNVTYDISGGSGDSYNIFITDAKTPGVPFVIPANAWISNNATTAIALKAAIDGHAGMSSIVNVTVDSDQNSTFTIVGDANGTSSDTFVVTINGDTPSAVPFSYTSPSLAVSTYAGFNGLANDVRYPPNNATFATFIKSVIDSNASLSPYINVGVSQNISGEDANISFTPKIDRASFTVSITPTDNTDRGLVLFNPARTRKVGLAGAASMGTALGGNTSSYAPTTASTLIGKDANLTITTKPGAWIDSALILPIQNGSLPLALATRIRLGQTYAAAVLRADTGPTGQLVVTPKTPTTYLHHFRITATDNTAGNGFAATSNSYFSGQDANITFISKLPGALFDSKLWQLVGGGASVANKVARVGGRPSGAFPDPISYPEGTVFAPMEWSVSNANTADMIAQAINRHPIVRTFAFASTPGDNTLTISNDWSTHAMKYFIPLDANITTGNISLLNPTINYGSPHYLNTGIVCDPGNGVGGNIVPSAQHQNVDVGVAWNGSNRGTAESIARAIEANGTTGAIVTARATRQGGEDFVTITSLVGDWIIPATTTFQDGNGFPAAGEFTEDSNSTTASIRWDISNQNTARQIAAAINARTRIASLLETVDVNATVSAWPSVNPYPGVVSWDPSLTTDTGTNDGDQDRADKLVIRSDVPGTPFTNSPISAINSWSGSPTGDVVADLSLSPVYAYGRHTGGWSVPGSYVGTNIWHIPWTTSNENTALLIATAISNTPVVNTAVSATVGRDGGGLPTATLTITSLNPGQPVQLHGPYLVDQGGGAAPDYTRSTPAPNVSNWQLYEFMTDAAQGSGDYIRFEAFEPNTTYFNRTWTRMSRVMGEEMRAQGGIRMDRAQAPNEHIRRYPGLHDNTGRSAEPDIICLMLPKDNPPRFTAERFTRASLARKPPRTFRAPAGMALVKDVVIDHNTTAWVHGDSDYHGMVCTYTYSSYNYTFAHALGHVLGASHAVGDIDQRFAATSKAQGYKLRADDRQLSFSAFTNTSAQGPDSFTSTGAKIQGINKRHYQTIMSYPRNQITTNLFGSTTMTNLAMHQGYIPYYSNPLIFYQGQRLSDRFIANNARCISEYGRIVSGYRDANNTGRQQPTSSSPTYTAPIGTPMGGPPMWTPITPPTPTVAVAPNVAPGGVVPVMPAPAPMVAVAPSKPRRAVPAASPISGFRRAPWGVSGGLGSRTYTARVGLPASRRVMILNPMFGDVPTRGNPTLVARATLPGRPGGGLGAAPSPGGGLAPGGGGLPTTPTPPRPGGGLTPGLPPSPPTPPPARPNPNLPNDHFATPQPLLPLPGSPPLATGVADSPSAQWYFNGHNLDATREAAESGPAYHGRSVWFIWPPTRPTGTPFAFPAGTKVEINTLGSNFDTVMGVFTGSRSPWPTASWAEFDNVPNAPWSRVILTVNPGDTFYILVDGKDGETGKIRVNLRLRTP